MAISSQKAQGLQNLGFIAKIDVVSYSYEVYRISGYYLVKP